MSLILPSPWVSPPFAFDFFLNLAERLSSSAAAALSCTAVCESTMRRSSFENSVTRKSSASPFSALLPSSFTSDLG